jgi:hypothetical protein
MATAAANACGLLYHLVPAEAWNCTKAAGTPYFPPTYEADGFIHLTKEPALLLDVANHFYKGVPGPWRVLEIDSARLTAQVGGAGRAERWGCYLGRGPKMQGTKTYLQIPLYLSLSPNPPRAVAAPLPPGHRWCLSRPRLWAARPPRTPRRSSCSPISMAP